MLDADRKRINIATRAHGSARSGEVGGVRSGDEAVGTRVVIIHLRVQGIDRGALGETVVNTDRPLVCTIITCVGVIRLRVGSLKRIVAHLVR